MHTLDLQFLDIPGAIATYLIPTEDGPVLIETGPHSTLENLGKASAAHGYDLADIRHVLLTHIHFDHAGAAWWFARQGATIYVHPRGLKHLAQPEKLVASAKRIYQDQMDYLWGRIEGIAPEHLRAMEDGEQLHIGDATFTAHFSPGHAVHHIAWQWENKLFAGDVAGVKIGNGPVVPPCPPPDIHLEDWFSSIEKIRQLHLDHLYLAHYGEIEDIDSHLSALELRLAAWANWMKPHYEAGTAQETIVPLFERYVQEELQANGVEGQAIQQYNAANPAWMSVAGLMRYWHKKLNAT